MVAVRELESELIAALEPVALACPDGSFDWDTWVQIGEFEVGQAAWCQASVAGPDDDFVPAIYNTFKALARGAAPAVGRAGSVRAALSDYVGRARRGDEAVPLWLAEYLMGASTSELVATVRRAGTWLERTRTVLDVPDFDRYVVGDRRQWDHPADGLRLRATIDLVEEATSRPVLVFPSIDDARLSQAAYITMIHALRVRQAAPTVLVLAHSSGEVQEHDRADLWERAVAATVVAAEAVAARGAEPIGLARTASFFTCRDCHWHDGCDVRVAAEEVSPGIRRGIRLA